MKQQQLVKKMSPLFLCLLTIGFFSSSCTLKRDNINVQGANIESLIDVESIPLWNHKIVTGKDFSRGSITKAEHLDVEKAEETGELKKWNIRFPKIVKFNTNSPYLKGVKDSVVLYGEPSSEYKLAYRLTPNFLKIYKVTPDEEISHYERPYSIKEKNGSWRVPVGGYRASYLNVEEIDDEDGRDRHLINKFPVLREEYKSATHIQIDTEAFIPFQRVLKTDLFPKRYFMEGEWYFSSSVIRKKPEEINHEVGYTDGIPDESRRKVATMLKFSELESFIRATNLARDDRLKLTEDQADLVFTIPTEWHHFRPKPLGTDNGLQEETDQDVHYKNRHYGEFSFTNLIPAVKGVTASNASERANNELVLRSITIRKDTFSFVIFNSTKGVDTKFSFLRAKQRGYKPRVYFKKDRNIFGNFGFRKFKLTDVNDYREEDFEKSLLLKRFNPNKKIVYRFSKQTPYYNPDAKANGFHNIDLRQAARNCVRTVNRAFKLAGTNIDVELKEDKDAELGSLDTNIINVLHSYGKIGALGVGPSVTDPLTGEIISATANVYVTNQQVALTAASVREFIKIESGRIKNKDLLNPDGKRLPLLDFLSKEIREYCPEVETYAKSVGPYSKLTTAEENKYVVPCTEKIVFKRTQGTICHEIGHNLGLKHNFFCSGDEENIVTKKSELEALYPEKEFPQLHEYYSKNSLMPKMSCVMDYAGTLDYLSPVMPMLQDIAAIAYTYGGRVIKKIDFDNPEKPIKLSKVDTNQAIDQQEAFKNSRKFKYCTDTDLGRIIPGGTTTPPLDPMCDRWDSGVNPVEKMEYLFKEFRELIVFRTERLDRLNVMSSDILFNRASRIIFKMAALYGTWRAYFSDVYSDPQFARVQEQKEIDDRAEDLKNDKNFPGAEYVGVSQLYRDFMSSILFLPDYYCVGVRDTRPKIFMFSFEDLQKEIVSTKGLYFVEGCDDDNVAELLASKKYGYTYLGSIGTPTQPIRYSLDPLDQKESYDRTGIMRVKTLVATSLVTRLSPTLSSPMRSRRATPSALDEPEFFEYIKNKMNSRIMRGLPLEEDVLSLLKEKKKPIPKKEDRFVGVFSQESSVYSEALKLMFAGDPKNKVLSALVLIDPSGTVDLSPHADDFAISSIRKSDIDADRPNYNFGRSNQYYQPRLVDGMAHSWLEEEKKVTEFLDTHGSALPPFIFKELTAKQLLLREVSESAGKIQ